MVTFQVHGSEVWVVDTSLTINGITYTITNGVPSPAINDAFFTTQMIRNNVAQVSIFTDSLVKFILCGTLSTAMIFSIYAAVRNNVISQLASMMTPYNSPVLFQYVGQPSGTYDVSVDYVTTGRTVVYKFDNIDTAKAFITIADTLSDLPCSGRIEE
jgi:hypothetical protein